VGSGDYEFVTTGLSGAQPSAQPEWGAGTSAADGHQGES